MRFTILLAAALTAVIIFIQAGCIGSTQLAGGGISGTGISSGPVTGIGSIVSNGVRFNTDSALVTFNGLPGDTGMLEVGMVVTVSGTFNIADGTGEASSVDFEHAVVGQVESVSEGFRVLGQVIDVDPGTIFSNTSMAQLAAGDHVAVSGLVKANGSIRATYVEKIPAPAQQVVVGMVTGLNAGASTFRILNENRELVTNGTSIVYPQQLVDYSQAQLNGFAGVTPANGDLVRITGTLNGDVLEAAIISNRQLALGGKSGDGFLLQGLVRAYNPAAYIQVNGHSVLVDTQTVYVNTTAAGMALDDNLQVEGVLDDAGMLMARRIIRLDRPTITIDATVEDLDPASGLITVLGLPVETNAFTTLDDSSSAALKQFSLRDVSAGERLIVKGYGGAGSIVATAVQRVDAVPGGEDSISGPVSLLPGAPVFEVAGLPVDTTGLQDFTDFHEGPLPIAGSGFFHALRNGMFVEARGSFDGMMLSPASVAITACCHFGVLDPANLFMGGADDIIVSWDGSLYTDPLSQTAPNMVLGSESPVEFFGTPWVMHDVRVFGPGNYTFTTTRGNTLQLDVGPGQVGAHLLADWNVNLDMDVVMLWEVDGIYQGSGGSGSDLGARGYLFNLACIDGDGDGIPGIAMVDGPFVGVQLVLNLNLAGH